MAIKVYIGRFPKHVTQENLAQFFGGFTSVSEIVLKKGFAFVVSPAI